MSYFAQIQRFSFVNNYFANLNSIVNPVRYDFGRYSLFPQVNYTFPYNFDFNIVYPAFKLKNNYLNCTIKNYESYTLDHDVNLTPSFNYTMPELPKIETPKFTSLTVNSAAKKSSAKTVKNTTVTVTDADRANSELKPGLFKGRLEGQEALVSKICRKYNVPTGLVASIICLETGYGTSNLAYKNNFGGVKKDDGNGTDSRGHGYYSSIERGLEIMIKNIADYPRRYSTVSAVDFDNIDAIGAHYAKDPNWSNKIKTIYNSRVTDYLA